MTDVQLAIAGATGWAGPAIADGAPSAPDGTRKSALAHSAAGQDSAPPSDANRSVCLVHGDVDAGREIIDDAQSTEPTRRAAPRVNSPSGSAPATTRPPSPARCSPSVAPAATLA
jgi:hypothetical protein